MTILVDITKPLFVFRADCANSTGYPSAKTIDLWQSDVATQAAQPMQATKF
jgi:hypothetical protein